MIDIFSTVEPSISMKFIWNGWALLLPNINLYSAESNQHFGCGIINQAWTLQHPSSPLPGICVRMCVCELLGNSSASLYVVVMWVCCSLTSSLPDALRLRNDSLLWTQGAFNCVCVCEWLFGCHRVPRQTSVSTTDSNCWLSAWASDHVADSNPSCPVLFSHLVLFSYETYLICKALWSWREMDSVHFTVVWQQRQIFFLINFLQESTCKGDILCFS